MKKILSIDGGGIRGLIPALVLANIERNTGKAVAECFDLIAGTSTGGILALGFSKPDAQGKPKYSAYDLAEIYEQKGDEIFPRSSCKKISSINGLINTRYSHEGLEEILDMYFGDDLLGSGLTRTLITSYDIENREPLFFKSWREEFGSVLMKHAARATSAAPTYFEPALIPIGNTKKALVDGGVFINSPSVSAYVEAKRLFPEEHDFFVLSLGTGELTRAIPYSQAKDWGKASWLLPLLSCVFDGVVDAAHYQMNMLLDDKYIRLQTDLYKASDDIDNVTDDNIKKLEAEAKELIRFRQRDLDRIYEILS
ncbi:MAG: patatin [Leptolyngbya sp. DLM2.Bin15]|nr:MAG: patatin [Leptolyngbya sp. DLM2.Bin15]